MEPFQLHGHQLCKFIGTKESFNIRTEELNSHRIGSEQQNDRQWASHAPGSEIVGTARLRKRDQENQTGGKKHNKRETSSEKPFLKRLALQLVVNYLSNSSSVKLNLLVPAKTRCHLNIFSGNAFIKYNYFLNKISESNYSLPFPFSTGTRCIIG